MFVVDDDNSYEESKNKKIMRAMKCVNNNKSVHQFEYIDWKIPFFNIFNYNKMFSNQFWFVRILIENHILEVKIPWALEQSDQSKLNWHTHLFQFSVLVPFDRTCFFSFRLVLFCTNLFKGTRGAQIIHLHLLIISFTCVIIVCCAQASFFVVLFSFIT